MSDELVPVPAPQASLVQRFADRYAIDAEKLLRTLKATCFRQPDPQREITTEQMMALLVVAEQYRLNPFTRELFAFDDKKGGIVPFVSVDGWARIINEHPQYDGAEFFYDETHQAMTCTIHRKDRAHPTVVTEYLAECKRGTAPWQTMPRRMLRHKALVQAARLAFGFAGIYDEDEAVRVRDGLVVDAPASAHRSRLQQVLTTSAQHFADPMPDPAADIVTVEMEMLAGELEACDTTDEAASVLERAASILGPDELAQLNERAAARFNQGAT